MPRLDPESLRLVRLQVQSNVLLLPTGPQVVPTPNPPLTPADAAAIYSAIARFGFTSFQLVPGGVQVASPDGATVVNLTGAGWSFVEDLSRTAGLEPAVDKLDLTVREFTSRFSSPLIHLNQSVDLQARWDDAPGGAVPYIERHFLKETSRTLAVGLEGLNYYGAGVRLSFGRDAQTPLPAGIAPAPANPFVEGFDLRIEPLFANNANLFIQATGQFTPTDDLDAIVSRVRFIRELIFGRLAPALTLE